MFFKMLYVQLSSSGLSPKDPYRDLAKRVLIYLWRMIGMDRRIKSDDDGTAGRFGQSGNEQFEEINTTTAGGRLIFHLMGALAEFERSLIIERTQAGLQAARKRGVRIGRPRSLTLAQVKHARKLIDSGERPASVANSLGINRSTLYRSMK